MELKKVKPSDILELQNVCTNSYSQIFADHWTSNGMDIYLEQQFGTDRLKLELNDSDYEYFFIQKNLENIGFIKVNHKSAFELSKLESSELEKMYILPNHSGSGIGKMALTKIIKQIRQKGKKLFFLCVIDTNKNAIAFYEKCGFKFHSKTRLDVPYFKEELKGMDRMCLKLN